MDNPLTPVPCRPNATWPVVLIIFNILGLLFAIVLCASANEELEYDGEQWALLGVLLFGGIAALVEGALFIAGVVLAARSKHPMWLRAFVVFSSFAAISCTGFALHLTGQGPARRQARQQEYNNVCSSGMLDAIDAHDVGTVARILDQHPTWLTLKLPSMTPLGLAVRAGDVAMVELLLSKKSSHFVDERNKVTALHIAAEQGDVNMAKLLVSRGFSIDARNAWGQTPLKLALMHERQGLVDYLASLHPEPVNAADLLVYFAGKREKLRILELLDGGLSPDARNTDGICAMHELVKHGDTALVGVLLDRGAHIDNADARGKTPLHWAAEWNETEMVRFLIGHGANPNSRDHDGRTPLHLAATRVYRDVPEIATLKALVELGADVSLVDNEGHTAADIARSNPRSMDAVHYLEQYGSR